MSAPRTVSVHILSRSAACPPKGAGRLAGRRAALLSLLAAATLAGCADRHSIDVGAIPDDYRTRHPIVVDESEVALEIPVTASDARLSLAQRGRVADFGRRFRTSRSAAIRVLLPARSVNERAASIASRDAVAVLKREGIPGNRILVQPYDAGGLGGAVPIRLAFSTLVAKTAPCGRWPDDLGNTGQNRNYFNFGCASQQNFAAQVADPNDLLTPRGTDPIDAARRTNMLEKYRLGQDTASQRPLGEVDYQW